MCKNFNVKGPKTQNFPARFARRYVFVVSKSAFLVVLSRPYSCPARQDASKRSWPNRGRCRRHQSERSEPGEKIWKRGTVFSEGSCEQINEDNEASEASRKKILGFLRVRKRVFGRVFVDKKWFPVAEKPQNFLPGAFGAGKKPLKIQNFRNFWIFKFQIWAITPPTDFKLGL